jgi:hypothetical protein
MGKHFVKYTLSTNLEAEGLEGTPEFKALEKKLKEGGSIWNERYGLRTLGSIERRGTEYVAFQGVIVGSTVTECKGILQGFKVEIRNALPGVKRISDDFVAFGRNM